MNGVLVLENEAGAQWEAFQQAIRNRTGIEQVSAALSRPFEGIASSSMVRYEGAEAPVNLSQFPVDYGFFELYGVELLAGRLFSRDFGTDRQVQSTEANPHPEMAVVLNQAMVEQLGWTPDSALGKTLEMNTAAGADFSQSIVGTVIGVVADMYMDPIQRPVVPRFFYVPEDITQTNFLFLKLPAGERNAQVQQVDAIWSELYPDTPLNAYMLEDKFAQVYQREERQLALLSAFASLAVFISCIGLIGLATYATELRVKEVGIRKTVGASVWQIIVLFSADFSRLVLISNVIAWPIAYVAMSRWLENFAYRIDLTPLIFIGSGLIALSIAWVTVGGTAAKAANARPVLALRYE
jgi:putative ABC transport system permease protein